MTAVSVLMPVFNEEARLEDAVASISAQTLRDWELVVVDDGSTDGTWPLLSKLAKREPRIKPVRIRHGGIVTALNAGFDHVCAPYVARMDADDYSMPARLQRSVAMLNQNPHLGLVATQVQYDGVVVDRDVVDRDVVGRDVDVVGGDMVDGRGLEQYVDWTNKLLSPDQIATARFIESPIIHPSVCFRKNLLRRFGGYRHGSFPEDYELWLRLLQHGVRMGKVPEPLIRWRDSPHRLTRNDPRCSVDAFYRIKSPYLARWLQAHNPHHPEIVVWGAGRRTRQRLAQLQQHGVHITAFIDVDPRKIGRHYGDAKVLGLDQLPSPQNCFILPMVASRNARSEIQDFLKQRGYRMGEHYIHAA